MDRRSTRMLPPLALIVIGMALLASQAGLGATPAGAAPGGPHSSLAGPTTFAAVGPTAIPLTTPWGSVLFVPSPATVQNDQGNGSGTSGKPGTTPAPTPNPIGPTSNPTLHPTSNPTLRPTSNPTAHPTTGPTSAPTAAPTTNPAPCTLFPSDNVWNERVDGLHVDSHSATLINAIGLTSYLHPDFSSTGYGIPYNKVNLSTPTYAVTFDYDDESDPGPYPIPASPKIEGGSDAHLVLWDTEGCNLYEIFAASKSGGHWYGGSGAIWDLRSNALRPAGWTSADAAGLPILPGLARYEEVAAGAIRHALRFTAPNTCSGHLYPATHDASDLSCTTYPKMGLRVRLKASVDISSFGPQAQVILLALKRYGMILADNGSPWYVTGAPNANWDDDQLHDFHSLHGSDFEVVDTAGLRNG